MPRCGCFGNGSDSRCPPSTRPKLLATKRTKSVPYFPKTMYLPRSSSDSWIKQFRDSVAIRKEITDIEQPSDSKAIKKEITDLAFRQSQYHKFKPSLLENRIKLKVLPNPDLSTSDISFLFNQIFEIFKMMMISSIGKEIGEDSIQTLTNQIQDFRQSLLLLFKQNKYIKFDKKHICFLKIQYHKKKLDYDNPANLFTEEGFEAIREAIREATREATRNCHGQKSFYKTITSQKLFYKTITSQKLFYKTITNLYQELWFQKNEDDDLYVLKDDRDAELRDMLLLFKNFLERKPLQTSYPTWFDETAYHNIYLIKENR